MGHTRRTVLVGLGLAGLRAAISPLVNQATAASLMERSAAETKAGLCPFKLAVINDEITQDFEKACQIVSAEFGLHWIELRSMWNKNVTELDAKQVEDAMKILQEHKLRVTDIASPLFKTDWPRRVKAATSFMQTSMPAHRISCWSGAFRLPNPSRRTGFAVSTTGGWMIRSHTARQSMPNCSRPRNAALRIT
jgi:hypothetical protein